MYSVIVAFESIATSSSIKISEKTINNTPNTKDGLMIESIKKCYWGIDQAAISFAYSFDIEKKGGMR